jgi:hypothetical protein
MRKFAVGMMALVIAPIIASGTARAGQQVFFGSRPAFFHQPAFFHGPSFFNGRRGFFNRSAFFNGRRVFFNRPAFFNGRRVFFDHRFFHGVPVGSSPIVPPFTSFTGGFTSFGQGSALSFPLFGDSGVFGGAGVASDSGSGVTLMINTAPPAPPPAPVVYNPPTVEKSAAGVEVVRLMNTSPTPP